MESDFRVIRNEQTLNVLLGKDLSIGNSTAMLEELTKYVGQGIQTVVFDATGLTFLSSSGIRCLLFAYQDLSNQPEIIFVNCADEVYEVLESVGLTAFIRFEKSAEMKELYRKRVLSNLSFGEAEQFYNERRKSLEQFAANNDVVCYSMKLGEEDT